MLEGTPFSFALELAVAASARDALPLEPWLQEQLAAQGPPFAQVLPRKGCCVIPNVVGNTCRLTSGLTIPLESQMRIPHIHTTTCNLLSRLVQQ